MKNVIDILQERGFIEAITSEEIYQATQTPVKVYCGFDPTSDSLHVGNLVALMGLAWFQRCGHTPVAIAGGATGMIGDPSGRSNERQLLSPEMIEQNLRGIEKNLRAVLGANALILNNYDWYKAFTFVDFLREIGKYFRVGSMLAKESVKTRLNSEEGMSFTEFSYQLLQAYDFLYLNRTQNVSVQIGGSDQWGNITAGIELIRKCRGSSVFGVTFPLLVRSDGQKFGKSEKGAIWLSEDKLSAYEFYQYFIRIPDADLIRLMSLLTFMEMDEIRNYEKKMKEDSYIPNTAQKRLAEEVTRLIHGEKGLQVAIKATEGAAPGSQAILDARVLDGIAQDIPTYDLASVNVMSKKLIDLLCEIGVQTSKGEARRLIQNGAVSINNKKIEDVNCILTPDQFLEGRILLLNLGKKNKVLIRVQ